MNPAFSDRLQTMRAEFAELSDSFDRYAYLVELAGLLPAYPEAQRTQANLVQGCQSQVWLHPYEKGGLFYFDADSDTLIIKGVLLLLQDLLCGQKPAVVAEASFDVLKEVGLREAFSSTRQNGIAAALKTLRQAAAESGTSGQG